MATTIREARLAAGLGQRALAERLGVSQSLVARWEAGDRHPTEEHLRVLLRELGLLVPADLGYRVVYEPRVEPLR